MAAILDQHRDAFESDPSNKQAFDALEEHFFMAGRWNKLVAAYEHRLEAQEFVDEPTRSIPILFRMAQIYEERRLDVDSALENYWKVAKLDPSHRPALRQLRHIYATREQWDMLLQIAEMEGQLAMEPHERATFLAELGDIWSGRLNDPTEALGHYEQALALTPDHIVALTGLARVHEGLGHHELAAGAWERLADRLRGPDRAPVLVSLGNILAAHVDQPDRAVECLQRALSDDPRCTAAVEALSAVGTRLEDWPLVAKLYERRFDIASGARKRTRIAVEAGRLNLEKLDDIQAARLWFDRALELADEDASVFDAIAELERRTGNQDALSAALDRVIALGGDDVPASILLESADLHSESGDEQRAVTLLREAQSRAPDNALIAETLSDSLSRLGLNEELVEILERRAALSQDDPQAESEMHAEIGRIHLEHFDDLNAAVASLARAFELDPGTVGVASKLEVLYHKREDWSNLRAFLERACCDGLSAERPHYFAALGELCEQQFDEFDEAVSAFESALELDPRCLLAHQGIARIVHASGSQDDRLRVSEREAEVTSDRVRMAELVWTMVPLLEERGRNQDALGWVEKLGELIPEDQEALRAIARLRETLGCQDELVDPLKRLDPLLTGVDQATNRRKLAELHRNAGRHEEAIEWYQSSLEGDANHLESLRSLKVLYSETREFEALAQTMRRLAEVLPEDERDAELAELATLLVDQLGDIEGAIVILWRLVELPVSQRPRDVAERLEDLLERAGRFEELAQQLLERRRALDDDSDEARKLDLRRARLCLDELGQYEEAATVLSSLRGREGEDDEQIIESLERALRLGNDAEGLVNLLAELALRESDATRAAKLELERATLLEDSLGAFDEAREALTRLATGSESSQIAERASLRLEQLFNRCGDWAALRDWLTERLGTGDDAKDLALHEELAMLCRDRFGERDSCAEHLEAAGKLAPDRQAIWHNLAVLYSELDQPEDLLRVLDHELSLDLDAEREAMLRLRAARLATDLPEHRQHCGEHYERLLELEPGNAEATEFLLDFYDHESRPLDMVRLLRTRLDTTLANGEPCDATASNALSLRLRIAALESETLDDAESAVATLSPALDEMGPHAAIAMPLADLYQRLGRHDEYVALCRSAADHCDLPEERASWLLRAGDTLRQNGDASEAARAYRGVLDARPQDLNAQSVLRELYRELGEVSPLVELLKMEAERRSGASVVPVLLELATLLDDALSQPEAALETFHRILKTDSRHPQAFERALDLTRRLGRHDEARQLLDTGLAAATTPTARALVLEQLADLEAGPFEEPTIALGLYREALTLDPSRSSIRASMCEILTKLGRFPELLDCLFLTAQRAESDERSEIFERAIEIASREISSDAALPWLERLHAEKPENPDVLSRIADIHRQAGRPEALLRALEAQMPLRTAPQDQHALQCTMAEILEHDLAAPGRAALTLEQTRTLVPDDPSVLGSLDRLYETLGRPTERAEIVEQRIACPGTAASQLATLHSEAATLWHAELSSPQTATRHLMHSINLRDPSDPDILSLTRQLQQTLRDSGRLDGWARAAESELVQLDSTDDANDDRRRYQLHSELASCLEHELAHPRRALHHLLALLDTWDGAEPLMPEQVETAEASLIHHLRRERNHVELELRLAARLDRIDGEADEWLELAHLQSDRLHRPSAARHAFRQVLEQQPHNESAIHGLRQTTETLHDWEGVAESLDRELALEQSLPHERSCALLRRLGDVTWHQLQTSDSLERASGAYRALLELVPDDLESIRALQQIGEEREEYAEAMSRYEQEVDLLGDGDSKRRQRAWLRIAELARDETHELERAIGALAAAADCAELSVQRLGEWADLYRRAEDWENFARVHGQWCDAPGTPAQCDDLLTLVDMLSDLGREDEALERAEMAIEADRTRAAAWERAAELREQHGDTSEAAEHLTEAAELRDTTTAVEHLLRASRMVSEQEPERSARLLKRAANLDAASPEVQARLALVSERLESWDEAAAAAGHALDMVGDRNALEPGLLLSASLAGGRSAWLGESLESAVRLFSSARKLEPENTEALDSLGELLYLCSDLRGARDVLECRLAIAKTTSDENEKTGRQLAIVGEALELDQEFSDALNQFERAIEVQPTLDQAHEGIVRTHERAEDPTAALAALESWCQVQEDDSKRATQLLRAARIDQSIEETDSAIARLHEASRTDPSNAGAWTMLADLLIRLDQPDEALATATSGLDAIDHSDRRSVALLSFVRGTALEQGGETAEAAAAYALAVDNDSGHSRAVLARATLLRDSGDWQTAADALHEYLGNHPEPTSPTLARVYYERGRLLAGPLERIEEAIGCYEHAIELDPDFTQAIEPLASLLSYMPDRWEEAVRQHGKLLADDPARESSIRSVIRICETRGDERARETGCVILRSLGVATSEEFENTSNRLRLALTRNPELPDPHWERLRKMVVQSSDEISQALAAAGISGATAAWSPPHPAQRSYWELLRAAEVELSAPGFDSLATPILVQTIEHVAALALDVERPDDTQDIADHLDAAIGRWARRKLRRVLDGTGQSDIASICWDDWRSSLRCVAASAALDRSAGDLRNALMALSAAPEDAGADEVADTTDISDRVRSMKPARALLRQVTQAWCSEIGHR